MIYLVLSFLAFLFATFAIVFFNKNFYSTDSHRGKLADLNFILKFLSTTDIEEAELKISVMRRVTWMDVALTEQGLTVELPFVTKQQISRKTKYIAICEKLGAAVEAKQNDAGVPLLLFGFSGDLDEVNAALTSCFAQIFDITDERKLEFAINAKRMDHAHLAKYFYASSKKDLEAVAPSSLLVDAKAELDSFPFFRLAAHIFLRPVILLASFMYGGFSWFCIALLVWAILDAVLRRFEIETRWLIFSDLTAAFQIGLAGIALWFSDQTYVQVLPSVVAGVMVLQSVFTLLKDWKSLPALEATNRMAGIRLKAKVGFIALGLAFIFGNEYLRSVVSFETWAWVYSFMWLEVIIGGIVVAIPLIGAASLLGFFEEKETP